MFYAEWKEILYKINSAQKLSRKNIITKIKRELKAERLDVYKEWKKEKFDVNYVFLVNEIDEHTLLHLSVFYNLKNVIKVLLECGADVNTKRGGITPLHLAAAISNGCIDIMEMILKSGADINVRDDSGKTFLHWIMYNIRINVIDIENLVNALLEKGADVNAADKGGKTLLHCAAECGYVKVVDSLLEKGADSLLQDKYGQIPRNLAKNKNIIQSLEAAEKELSKMKDEKIGKSTISFYQIFKADGAYLADYIRNVNVREELREGKYKNRYPIHALAVDDQYKRGIEREYLEKRALEPLGYLCASNKGGKGGDKIMNEDVCRVIASYLTDADLKSVKESVKKSVKRSFIRG
jgi:ankyrin repeat protein